MPTLCTSSSNYHFGARRFFSVNELLRVHGYPSEKVSWKGLSEAECKTILGNINASPSLAVALTVCLKALGVLRQEEQQSQL